MSSCFDIPYCKQVSGPCRQGYSFLIVHESMSRNGEILFLSFYPFCKLTQVRQFDRSCSTRELYQASIVCCHGFNVLSAHYVILAWVHYVTLEQEVHSMQHQHWWALTWGAFCSTATDTFYVAPAHKWKMEMRMASSHKNQRKNLFQWILSEEVKTMVMLKAGKV